MTNPALHNESDLIEKFAQGSEAAFTEVYQLLHIRVLYFARRYVNDAEAEDVTAEAFVQLWNHKADFNSLKAVSAFLFITARNRCYNLIKHNKMRLSHERTLGELMDEETGDPFALEQLRIELLAVIAKEVEKLPERLRTVFLLSFKEGLKPAQIAQRLQVSVKTVSNQKLTAIRVLQAALQGRPNRAVLLILLHLELHS